MLKKRWKLAPQPTSDEIKALRQAINASEPLAKLLLQRDIKDFETARKFFNPSTDQLHPPFLMKDMQRAVDRITKAIESGENILVYGDYDVDGTTAVSLVYSFLSNQYDQVSYYIPDRYGEGYGISMKSVDYASDNDISLVIALDCGIKAVEQVKHAASQGIDFIICDHHLPGKELPAAHAILNPLQEDCDYPYKGLSGCGIGFKLLQALLTAWDLEPALAFHYIDLVAVSTACDIVPMVGENRVLTHFGLRRMEQSLRPGLQLIMENGGLCNEGRLKRMLHTSDLVFVIGPRINAAGRMDHGSVAVDLLTAESLDSAKAASEKIIQSNTDRRDIDLKTLDEALSMVKGNAPLEQAKTTVLFGEHWHKGVIGIVASRMQDHYYKPTIMLAESDGVVTGSARSVKGFDVHKAVEACSELLLSYGGHTNAAGLTMNRENVEAFQQKFEEVVARDIDEAVLVPFVETHVEIGFDQIHDRFFQQVERLEPYGPFNMRPVFMTKGCLDRGSTRRVGDGSHLKMDVFQESNPDQRMQGIAFGFGEHYDRIANGESFDLAYSLEMNEFRGRKTLEMTVRDIRFSAEASDS